MSFNPNVGPIVIDRDESGNILFSDKATGNRLLQITADGIIFKVAPSGVEDADVTALQADVADHESRISALEAEVFTTTTTAGA
jgi:hypothetical protein